MRQLSEKRAVKVTTVQASPRVVRAASRARIIQIGLTGLRGREIAREKKRAGNRENIVISVSETFYLVRKTPVIIDCEAAVCKAHRESSGVAWPFAGTLDALLQGILVSC